MIAKNKALSKMSVLLAIAMIISIIGSGTGNIARADSTSTSVSFVQGSNGYTGTLNQLITTDDSYGSPNNDNFQLRDYSGGKKIDLLLAFDLSSIPYNAVIDSASMDLTLYSYFNNPLLKLYPIESNSSPMWVEGMYKANWYNKGNGFPWTIAGSNIMDAVDKSNPVTLTFPGGGSGAIVNTGDITSLVQSWVDDPTSNQGWLLEPSLPGDDGSSYLFVNGKDNSTMDYRPKLNVTYHIDPAKTAPPTPTPVVTPTPTDTPVPVTPTPPPVPEEFETPMPPQAYVDTTYEEPSGGNVISVPAGGNLQAALDTAQPGDVIELQPGATYYGNFKLPNKTTGDGWIYIRPAASAYGKLPAPGTRILPADTANMPKIVTTGTSPAITTRQNAHNYRLIGLEIASTNASPNVTQYGLVALGDTYETDVTKLARDIIIDRCYIHGNATGGHVRGVFLNSRNSAIVDSYISEIHDTSSDAQAICGINGPGPYKIVNNFLEASGENIMFGGGNPAITGLVPSDIEIRNNYFFKPSTWDARSPDYAGIRWSVKNLFEIKNGQRVLLDGNVLENNWTQADQSGTAIVLTPRNQNGNGSWCVAQDLTITNNHIKNVAHGFGIASTDSEVSQTRDISFDTKRILIKNNLFDGIDVSRGDGNYYFGTIFNYPRGSHLRSVMIDHNTIIDPGLSIFMTDWNSGFGQFDDTFVFTNNIVNGGNYGFISYQFAYSNPIIAKNAIVDIDSYYWSMYKGNLFPDVYDSVGFTDLAGKDYRLTAASPYHNAATNGSDIGADINQLNTALSGVICTVAPAPTAEPTPSSTQPVPTDNGPTPTPNPNTPAPGEITYGFNDLEGTTPGTPIIGVHADPEADQNSGVDFGDGQWTFFQSSNGLTNCACFTNNNKTATIGLPVGKTLKKISLSTGGNQQTGSTYTYKISSPGNPDVKGTFHGLNVVFDVETNWTVASPVVTIEFSGGWDSVIDNIVYDDGIIITQTPTPPPPPITATPRPDGDPGEFTYSFGDMTGQSNGTAIDGIHAEPGTTDVTKNGVGFENGVWSYYTWSNNLTDTACFTDNIQTTVISLPGNKKLKQVTLSTGGNETTGSTYTYKLSSYGNPDVTGTFQGLNVVFDVPTNWQYVSPYVTITFSGGWDSVIDNIIYDDGLPLPTTTPPPTQTNTPTGTPTGTPTVTQSPSPTPVPVTFPDLQGYDWAKDSIESLATAGIINGTRGDDGILYYKPGNTVTRAEFCKLIVKAFSFTLTGTPKEFSDVDGVNHWAKADVAVASSLGIVKGYDDGNFRPDAKISRQELAVMITRAMNKAGIGTAVADNEVGQILGGFTDQADISSWARNDVAFASKNGLVKGSPVQGGFAFNPLNQATRAETAVIIKRAYDAKNNA